LTTPADASAQPTSVKVIVIEKDAFFTDQAISTHAIQP
jgi:hypothetical protein